MIQTSNKLLIFILCIYSLFTFCCKAENVKTLTIKGTIDEKMYKKLLLLDLNNTLSTYPAGLIVLINSPGGDVYSAMKIGKLLRSKNAQVFVTNRCDSACILVFAGGVIRDAQELSLGIHRFTININNNKKELAANLSVLSSHYSIITANKIKNYLDIMGVNKSLFYEMEKTPSESIDKLSRERAKKFNLIGYDPHYITSKSTSIKNQKNINVEHYLFKLNFIASECINSKVTNNTFLRCYSTLLEK
ncbi:hypothetical protein FERRO_18330 [Ferrovum sp. JA12]|uniref:ATP-dependent Clp protease proteolytic subunit n=1 Tax=Ferrovum sp. JA12 TaxID=1356299 RepID=UPI0007038F57|nr:ATP-dependent Clp protease proteolytic subunit [Ferrovum sp. JA12]KRH78835.1 hypothetical protein FERRO_18330 [Ferrovum sp. JA12]